MQVGFYEPHTMPNEKIPFLFHLDTIRKRNPDIQNLAHWHPNIEILYFLEGQGEIICDAQATPVVPGDIFVINSNSMHSIVSDNIVRYHCLIADRDFCAENDLQTDNILIQNHIRDAHAAELFEKIVAAYAHQHTFYHARIRSAVLALLVYLCCNYADAAATSNKRIGGKAVENIKLAMGYLQTHYMQKLTLEAVADEVGLSPYHFSREFKKVTGVTFVGYVNRLRCEHAKKLLQSGKCNVADACIQSGFENASYFSKTFKAICAKSPSSYLTKE